MTIKNAIIINICSRYINIFIQLLANAILARLLNADDYGVIAIVLIFTSFFALLSDMGLGAGIIQNKQLAPRDINNIFSLTFYFGIVLMGLFLLLSFPISWFYSNNDLQGICCLLSISVFFSALNIIPDAVLRKEKRFVLVGVRTVLITILSSSLAIFLASYGYKYYSVVIQSIILSFLTFLVNYKSAKVKFIARFEFISLRKILGFSVYDFGYNIINYFARNMDNLLTGKFMGTAMLGYYSRAYNLMSYPVANLTHVITPVLHPIFSDYQGDKNYIYDKYIRIYKFLSLIGVFVSIFCFFSAKEIVYIVYGSEWDAAVPCMAALGLSTWFQMTSSSCGSIYRSLNMTKLMFRSVTRFVPIQLLMIVIGVINKDIVILSWCVGIGFVFKYFIEYYYLIRRGFEKSFIRFLSINLPEVLISLLMALVLILTDQFIKNDNIYFLFLIKFSVCLVTYVLGLFLTKQHIFFYSIVPNKIKTRIAKKREIMYE